VPRQERVLLRGEPLALVDEMGEERQQGGAHGDAERPSPARPPGLGGVMSVVREA
jgi:hypothetical protein